VALRIATVPALEALPGVVHGFERRAPGTASESRDGTRERVSLALRDHGRLFLLRQVHGSTARAAPFLGRPEGDAVIAAGPGVLAAVETADCLPVLLVDPVRRVSAAVHAGWRGTAAGVAARTAFALLAGGSRPHDLVAGVGPGIGACCYEVGEELRDAFGPEGEPFFRPGPRGRPHLDVRAANVRQLVDVGIPGERIHHVAECTFCGAEGYHSYRRDGPGGGRMVSFVGYSSRS